MRRRLLRSVIIGVGVCGMILVAVGIWLFRPSFQRLWIWANQGTVTALANRHDVRWKDVRKMDLREEPGLLQTLRFNVETRWPAVEKLPPGISPGDLLTNAMNPGLGVRDLHRAGISGKGVHVAIIDYDIEGEHPEYAGKIVEIHRVGGARGPSMHGPAVASLLVGANCGTAPGALLHFVATPDGVADAVHYADALDWIIERNKEQKPMEKIRIVSISAAPSGKALHRFRNGELYDKAVVRAEQTGLLVIDGTKHGGFVGPCNLDPKNIDDPGRCRPIPARGKSDFYAGRILAPTGPRTTAEEYWRGDRGYQYCGLQTQTLFGAGSSWSMPYVTGVLAMGLQLRPDLSPHALKDILFESAFVRADGKKIIHPKAFIEAVNAISAKKQTPDG